MQDLARVHIPTPEEIAELERQQREQAEMMRLHFEHQEMNGVTGELSDDEDMIARNSQQRTRATYSFGLSGQQQQPRVQRWLKMVTIHYANLAISRNAPCPCGSGLKYKQCHGKI